MKRMSVIGLILALVLSLGAFTAVSAAVVNEKFYMQDVSVLETGTYRVTVAEDKDMGFFVINDENGDAIDYVIITGNSYGYIFFDTEFKGYSYDIKDVDFELVSNEDLGVSGYHVFEHGEGNRDYDPVIDGEYKPTVIDCDKLSEEELASMFS